jgi:hypothetical protein
MNTTLPEAGDMEVAKDREDPGFEVGPRLELVSRRKGANYGILHKIVGTIVLAAQNARKASQVR